MPNLSSFVLALLLLSSYSFGSEQSSTIEPPFFIDGVNLFCESNPYDCMSGEIVDPHRLNSFLYTYYLSVENFFIKKGFTEANFEYCLYGNCLEEGVNVLGSQYKITKIFPHKRDFFRAFGGVNKNSGVYFSKLLDINESNQFCTLSERNKGSISSKAQKLISSGKVKNFKDLKKRFFKKHKIKLSQYYPSIDIFNENYQLPAQECWLVSKSKKIVFEVKGN